MLFRFELNALKRFGMNFVDVFLLALALSVDAAVVAFSYGLITKKNRLRNAFLLALFTGAGQFFMPLVGWLGTESVSRYIAHYDHWISFLVFLYLGLNIINQSLKDEDHKKPLEKLSGKTLFFIGIATSIDACAAGVTLYFIKTPILIAAAVIGSITFINSFAGFFSCCLLKKIPTRCIEIFSGVILILLGCKVLYEHLSA